MLSKQFCSSIREERYVQHVLILVVIIILRFIENSPGHSCYYKHFTTGQVLIAKGLQGRKSSKFLEGL